MDRHLRALIATQHGTITRRQALAGEMTKRQVDHLLQTGQWVRVYPGVFRLDTVPPSARQAVWAAALWSDDGILSGMGAAWWWEVIPDPPRRWEFLVCGSSPRSRQTRVVLQRRWVDPVDVTVRDGLRVLALPLAVLRAASLLELARRGHGVRLIDRSKQTNLVQSHDLEAAFLRNRGTWGRRPCASSWIAPAIVPTPIWSVWESLCCETLVSWGSS